MTAVADALVRYRRDPSPSGGASSNPFKLVSTLGEPAAANEIGEAWRGHELPGDAVDLWTASRESRLFEDVDYGQWGLALLAPSASAARTAQERESRFTELRSDDIVLGEFLGDQELLVLAPSETGQRRVMIALPLDSRSDWFGAAEDLGQFLERYYDHVGCKYWERKDLEAESEDH